MLKKCTYLVVAGLMTCATLFSQTKHEIRLNMGLGMSTLNMKVDNAKKKNQTGGGFDLNYKFYLTDKWSIGTGIGIAFHNAQLKADKLSDAYMTTEGGVDMEYRVTTEGYKEDLEFAFFNIPLVAQFETPVFGQHKFYASAGMKFGIPTSKDFKVKQAKFNNSGYYPDWNVSMGEQEFVGFGEKEIGGTKGKAKLKTSYMMSLETGMKWKMTDMISLYTGVYFDYGFNDINKTTEYRLAQYNPENPQQFISNSLINSSYTSGKETRAFVDKVKPMAIGIKIGLGFTLD